MTQQPGQRLLDVGGVKPLVVDEPPEHLSGRP